MRKLGRDSSLQGDALYLAERRAELRESLRRQVLNLLTEEQHAQCERLFAEPPPP